MTNSRTVQIVIAAVFLTVGVISVINDINFSYYVRDTVQRDSTQEACQTETLATLKLWASARIDEVNKMHARDRLIEPIFIQLIKGQPIMPEDIQAAAEAERAFQQSQAHLVDLFNNAPLPNCKVRG